MLTSASSKGASARSSTWSARPCASSSRPPTIPTPTRTTRAGRRGERRWGGGSDLQVTLFLEGHWAGLLHRGNPVLRLAIQQQPLEHGEYREQQRAASPRPLPE